MKNKKKTVGALSRELQLQEKETRDPIELEREMHKDYEKNFWETYEEGKKTFPGDFFIVVITKKERIMENVLRNMFFCRISCPTPDYDQAVYRFNQKEQHIEFLWVIPDKETCIMFKENVLKIDPSEHDLRNFVLDFADGTLYERALRLNKEIPNAVG
jgi:hypothetical protein